MIKTLLAATLVLTLAACDSSPSTSSSADDRAASDAIGMALIGFSNGYNANRGTTCWNYGPMIQCH